MLQVKKQPPEVLYKKGVLKNCKIHKKTPVPESLLIKFVTLLKKRLWHMCVPVNSAKYLGTPFLQNTSGWLLLQVID